MLHTLEVATVLALELFLNELFKTIWISEEAIVLHNLQLLALCVFADADVLALEDLGAEVALVEVELLSCLSSVTLGEGVLGDHGSHILVDLELGLLSFLLGVVDVFELIKVHGVQFEVGHVHFVFHLLRCLLLQVHGSPLAFLNKAVDVLITQLITDGEDAISTVIDHVLHLVFAQSLALGG